MSPFLHATLTAAVLLGLTAAGLGAEARHSRHRVPRAQPTPAPNVGPSPADLADLANQEGRYPWRLGIVTTIFWIGEPPAEKKPRLQCRQFLGFGLADLVWRLRRPRPRRAPEPPAARLRPETEPVLHSPAV